MPRDRDAKRYVAIATVIGIAAFVGIVFAFVPAGRREVIEPSAQRAAARSAQTYALSALERLKLPAGARRLTLAPGPAARPFGRALRSYPHRMRLQRYAHTAQAHAFWTASVPPAQAIAQVAAHPPPGTASISCLAASCLIYLAPAAAQLGPAELAIAVTLGRSGRTRIHAASTATWSPYPQALPEGVTALTVTVLPLRGAHREEKPLYGPKVISKPAQLRLIADTIGQMQAVAEGQRAPCHRSPSGGEIRLSFTQGPGGAPLAGLSFTRYQCAPLTLTTEDSQTAVHLQEVPATFRARRVLADALDAALGVRLPGS